MWQILIPAITGILDKILPDPQAAAAAKIQVMELVQRGEMAQLDADLRLALAQSATNTEEAKTDTFRGGWRPACGWVCAAGLLYTFLLQPLLPWFVSISGHTVPPLPDIDSATLMSLLFGMLGLGGLRTFERIKGKA
jgi:hypothetical protein